jgi:type IV secretory pathway TraG/TraD family ATPase VirD4
VGQIVEQFKKAWRNVVQNCGVTIWFGARDSETQKTVSDLTGMVEVHSRSKSLNYRDIDVDPQMTESVSQTSRPFMYPADVGRLNDNEMICFVEGVKVPIKAIRKPYTKVFSGYSPNPYYDGRSRFGKWFGGRK